MSDLINRLRIKAGMIQMGERIEWGSDSNLMYEAADMIEQLMARDEQYTPADMADQGAQGWRDGYRHAKGEGCMEAAAPAVQGEPVGLRQLLFNGWKGCSNHGCVVVDPKPGMVRTNGSCQCVVNASRSQLYMLQGRIQSVLSATPQPAEQQPVPDVAGLVEALEEIIHPVRFMQERLEEGERLNGMAAVQLAEDASYLRGIARSALAAHQKRETSHDNQ